MHLPLFCCYILYWYRLLDVSRSQRTFVVLTFLSVTERHIAPYGIASNHGLDVFFAFKKELHLNGMNCGRREQARVCWVNCRNSFAIEVAYAWQFIWRFAVQIGKLGRVFYPQKAMNMGRPSVLPLVATKIGTLITYTAHSNGSVHA